VSLSGQAPLNAATIRIKTVRTSGPPARRRHKRGTVKAHAPFVSPGAVALRGHELGFTQGFLVRDPDGHVLQIVEVP